MSKLAKFIALAGGALGVLGFFLPLFSVSHEGFEAQFTAYSLVRGIERVEDHIEVTKGAGIDEQPETKAALEVVNKRLAEYRPVFYGLYAPAGLLLLFAVLAIAKASMGRFLGFLTFAVGGIGVAVWFLLQTAITELVKEADFAGGVGTTAILVSGVLGAVAGALAVIAPDDDYEYED